MRPEKYIQAAQAYLVASAQSRELAPDSDRPPPFVTISREAGAGAHSLAEILIDRLNESRPEVPWAVFDENLVQQVLRDHDLPSELERYMGEDRVTEVRELLEVWLGLHPHTDALVSKINATIIALARMGHVVIVGRGGHVLTRALKGGLHLRLISSFEKRRDRIAELHGIEVRAAAERVTALDTGRRAYVKRHFNADVTDPRAYDLIVNTETLPLEDVATMVSARLAPELAQAGIR
jgi:cytidylate kinase